MLTETKLQFKQVFSGQVWKSHEFPVHTPVKEVAQRLHLTEGRVATALRKHYDRVAEYQITQV